MAKGYSFAALVDVLYPAYKTSLGNGVNLNDFNSFDHVGVYVQSANANAAGGSNYPEPSAGCLEVLPNAGGVVQRYTVYTGNNATYVRSNYGGTWGLWKKYLTDNVIYNTVYPVGICIQFDANVNPNTAFPGTTWAQIVDGRQVRAAESAAAIGTTGGSDTVTLAEGNLPVHTHTVATHSHTIAAHSHTMAQHSHTVDSHSHTMAQHSHIVDSHSHSANHNHTASATSNGGHNHLIANGQPGAGAGDSITLTSSNYLCGSGQLSSGSLQYALKGNTTAPDRGLSSTVGAHTHTIAVDTVNFSTGTSAPGTNTAGATATGTSAPGTNTAGATATGTGGPTATDTGGPSATGSVGSGTAVSVAGAWHKYAIWKRTA